MNESCKVICFTSACGGVGTSSAAVCMGRSLSRFKEINTLIVGLDFIACKAGRGSISKSQLYDALISEDGNLPDFRASVSEDCYGLKYLGFNDLINPLHSVLDKLEGIICLLSDDFDCIIIDCPSNCSLGLAVFQLCDAIVVTEGFRGRNNTANDKLMRFLELFSPQSELIPFPFEEDEDGFAEGEADIHGQFGAEVRRLAEKIFKENICS